MARPFFWGMGMTHYVLRKDLSYCRVGDQLVFMDIGSDRYFQIPHRFEQIFLAHVNGFEDLDSGISYLIERSILVEQTKRAVDSRPDIQPAVRSAMEAPHNPQRLRVRELIEVFAIVLRTRFDMKTSTLSRILDRLSAERYLRAAQAMPPANLSEHHIANAVAAFRRGRLYVPIEMCCLLDSMAMTRFLLRRRIHAHVVFGIALDPFSAHCWVQVGDLVLNDSVGNVHSHTPIRVV